LWRFCCWPSACWSAMLPRRRRRCPGSVSAPPS
jgi:hypothetical protein